MERAGEQARFATKWGEPISRGGFSAVPNLLLEHQSKLGISPTEMCVLLQILRFYWFKGRDPFPSVGVLEAALPIQRRSIQRALRELQKKGLVERRKATRGLRPEYDLTGLRTKLDQLAPPPKQGTES